MLTEDNTPYDTLVEKWNPLLDHNSLEPIGDYHKKKVTAVLLENQQTALREQAITEQAHVNAMGGNFADPQTGSAGNLAGYDPVLISLVRRAMPNLMAYDICGVQPMTAPTGLIFAMRSKYKTQTGTEALFQEANPFAGNQPNLQHNANDFQLTAAEGGLSGPFASGTRSVYGLTGGNTGSHDQALQTYDFRGMSTSTAEALGSASGVTFNDMAFDIDRIAVEAKTKALKAEYTTELAQDLKAVHGLDAETELANILSTEILTEINREIVRTVYHIAKLGCQQSDIYGRASGTYDLYADSDGRWSAERFRGLMFQIEREANIIAKQTRRGKGNFVICTSDVASALAMGGFLNISPALNVGLEVDDTGNTFVGTLNGKFKVYVDPYSASNTTTNTTADYAVVGYRGASPYDAGFFYCPYVPLQMVRAVDPNTFQPKIGFKTRYGMVANPFAESTDLGSLAGNQYYRIFGIKNLHGIGGASGGFAGF
tara:strand:+ start:10482 stop:11936 length:1455 start_codon:yes stop_codon:yes gene_type:complete